MSLFACIGACLHHVYLSTAGICACLKHVYLSIADIGACIIGLSTCLFIYYRYWVHAY